MALPRVVAVASGSPADRAGVLPGDELVALDGQLPRDIIEYHLLTDQETLALEVSRGGLELLLQVEREGGEPLGMEVDAALFDQVRTCDNHCEFCFIHQLPKGMRKSLYVRDDDYRLSFLYGNFTTLTRFTEADLERVLTEGLSPLFVSIHATDPEVRARMLRNRRGATSLRWLRALLDGGVEVHGQVVVCPGVNDGDILETTMAGVLDEYPELASVAFVPLGVSRFNHEDSMRPHTGAEAATAVDLVEEWQEIFLACVGRRLVYASDEYYLVADRPFPALETYWRGGPARQWRGHGAEVRGRLLGARRRPRWGRSGRRGQRCQRRRCPRTRCPRTRCARNGPEWVLSFGRRGSGPGLSRSPGARDSVVPAPGGRRGYRADGGLRGPGAPPPGLIAAW